MIDIWIIGREYFDKNIVFYIIYNNERVLFLNSLKVIYDRLLYIIIYDRILNGFKVFYVYNIENKNIKSMKIMVLKS